LTLTKQPQITIKVCIGVSFLFVFLVLSVLYVTDIPYYAHSKTLSLRSLRTLNTNHQSFSFRFLNMLALNLHVLERSFYDEYTLVRISSQRFTAIALKQKVVEGSWRIRFCAH
jgi:hypothetical protein